MSKQIEQWTAIYGERNTVRIQVESAQYCVCLLNSYKHLNCGIVINNMPLITQCLMRYTCLLQQPNAHSRFNIQCAET